MASGSGKEISSGSKIRAARLSAQQFEVLIQFMQQNPHFAIGRAAGGSYSKEEHDTLWQTLSSMLNETEGPLKSVTKWQKCWVDLKSNARSRAAKWRAMSPDGPPPPGGVLTQWDQRVLSLLSEINSSENKFAPVVGQTPIQLLEVGFSEQMMLHGTNGVRSSRSAEAKYRSIAPKPITQNQNGFHDAEDGAVTMESVSSHEFSVMDDMQRAEEDVEEIPAEVKSEGEEWPEEDNGDCEDIYPINCMTSRLDSVSCGSLKTHSSPIRYVASHHSIPPSQLLNEEFSRGYSYDRSKKRKQHDSSESINVEESFEKISKKICGTLDRLAVAAEKANTIQQGMVTAMNRLASSFEQLLPAVAKALNNNSNVTRSS